MLILFKDPMPFSGGIRKANLAAFAAKSYLGKSAAEIQGLYAATKPVVRCGYSALVFRGDKGEYITTFIFRNDRVVGISAGQP